MFLSAAARGVQGCSSSTRDDRLRAGDHLRRRAALLGLCAAAARDARLSVARAERGQRETRPQADLRRQHQLHHHTALPQLGAIRQ